MSARPARGWTRPAPLAAFAGLTASAGLTVFVARGLTAAPDVAVDRAVRRFLLVHPVPVAVARVVTWAGHPLVVDVAVLVLAAMCLTRGRGRTGTALVTLGSLSLLARWAVKVGVDRSRPPLGFDAASGAAFPSGHTSGAAFLAVAVVLVAGAGRHGVIAAAAAGYVLVVATSRVALGVHWLTDVVGGVLLGAGFALLLPPTETLIKDLWSRDTPVATTTGP